MTMTSPNTLIVPFPHSETLRCTPQLPLAALRERYMRFRLIKNPDAGYGLLAAVGAHPLTARSIDGADGVWRIATPLVLNTRVAGDVWNRVGADPNYPNISNAFLDPAAANRLLMPNIHGFHRLYLTRMTASDSSWYGVKLSLRQNLNPEERAELAELVRRHVKDSSDMPVGDIADFLNDAGASSSIVDSLSCAVGALHYAEDCGHFCDGQHAHPGLSGSDSVCGNCANNEFVFCEDSRRYVRQHLAYWVEYLDAWYEDEPDERPDEPTDELMDYSTNVCSVLRGPQIASTSGGPFTIGVELEVYADDRDEFVSDVLSEHSDDLICKSDGSLDSDYGVELVTRPLLPKQAIDLFECMDFPSGTTAWDNGQCGMHVHIDSRAFDEDSFAKFMSFWNDPKNASFIRSVAGRHPDRDEQARDYARLESMDFDGEPNAKERLQKSSAGVQRYRCVNLCNLRRSSYERLGLDPISRSLGTSDTVELRIFRATLRKERLLAQIEMAVASVHFSRFDPEGPHTAKAFKTWLAEHAGEFPKLASFVGVEPAEEGEIDEELEG